MDGRVAITWTVLLPLRLADPKGRLASVDSPRRLALAQAMADDVLRMTKACPQVAEIVVVADELAARAFSDHTVYADPGDGLNAALTSAARSRGAVAALLPDVPAATATQLSQALDQAAGHQRSFVADAEGVGTTMLTALSGDELRPEFGPRSSARHAASGAVAIVDAEPGSLAGLRRDVDDEIALWDAVRLGVGPQTAAVLAAAARHV